MLRIILLYLLGYFFVLEASIYASADCSRFVPAPIWNFHDLMGTWKISGYLDSNVPGEFRYMEMGSSWTLANADDTFEMWSYGTMTDAEGNELMFDDWRTTKYLDSNRPGDLVQFRDSRNAYSNATILYFDNDIIMWVHCSIDEESLKESSWVYMGSKSGNIIPNSHKEQFKSILKIDYGMDTENKYIDIPQPQESGSSTSEPITYIH